MSINLSVTSLSSRSVSLALPRIAVLSANQLCSADEVKETYFLL